MARLLDDHRRGYAGPCPVSPDERVRHVPGGDVLPVLDGDHLTDHAGGEHVVEGPEERCVPEDVGDVEMPGRPSGGPDEVGQRVQGMGQGLFDEDLVPGGEGVGGVPHMEAVRSGDHGGDGEPSRGPEFGGSGEASGRWDRVEVGEAVTTCGVGIYDSDETESAGMTPSPFPIHEDATLTRPHQHVGPP